MLLTKFQRIVFKASGSFTLIILALFFIIVAILVALGGVPLKPRILIIPAFLAGAFSYNTQKVYLDRYFEDLWKD